MCIYPSDTIPYFTSSHKHLMGLQVVSVVKNLLASAGDARSLDSNPGPGRFPWRRKWLPTPVFSPEESHGQRSLASYSSWGHKDRTHEPLSMQKRLIASPRWGWMSEACLYIPISEHRMFLLCILKSCWLKKLGQIFLLKGGKCCNQMFFVSAVHEVFSPWIWLVLLACLLNLEKFLPQQFNKHTHFYTWTPISDSTASACSLSLR